jgi:chaperonin GroES
MGFNKEETVATATAQKKTTAKQDPPFKKPVGDRIVVREEAAQDVTPGGIVLPTQSREKSTKGLVVAVGSGHRTSAGERVPLEVSVGDTVMYSAYGGSPIEVEGEKFIVIAESDVLLIL